MADETQEILSSRCKLERTFLKKGHILLYGDFNEELAYNVVNEIKYLCTKEIDEITIFIHSDGGSVDACCAIIDAIEIAKKKGYIVRTVAEGKAYSAGGFVLAMGSEGYRLATPLSMIMIHEVSTDTGYDSMSKINGYMEATIKQMDGIYEVVAKALGRKTKKAVADFKEEIKKDIWMNVKEAIKYKIIDGIYEGETCATS